MKILPRIIPQYRTVSTDNDRHFISGISDETIDSDLDNLGELSARDAENPGNWLRIFRRGGKLVAEDDPLR